MSTRNYLPYGFWLFILAIIAVSCATPIAPTGGPADKTGPVLEYTQPKTGTTQFEGKSIEFQFDEYVNRSSVAGAITVEPGISTSYDIDWKRKKMILDFDRELPDSTTVIITLGADISDTRGNKMGSPITVAISTGDEIDEGAIKGEVKSAKDGDGLEGKKILLYRYPVDYSRTANYQAITDTAGKFEFNYLREGRYQALMVDDKNRNKIWDRNIEAAQPFQAEFIDLEDNGSDSLKTIYTVQRDTVAPKLQGLGLLSTQRMRLRFSEPIKTNNETRLIIQDSTGNKYTEADPLYIPEKDNYVLLAQSRDSLKEDESYLLNAEGITDLQGNLLQGGEITFEGSAQEDTTLQRIISEENNAGSIRQDENYRIRYATVISQQVIRDSLVVIEGDVSFNDWPEVEIQLNELIIKPQKQWIAGVDYRFLPWNPKTRRRKMFNPEVWDSTDYGQIEFTLNDGDSSAVYHLELLNASEETVLSENIQSGYVASDLPPVNYVIRIYEDLNDNGQWDFGTIIPFEAPEPYYVQRGISVQSGFTSQVSINFKVK